MPASPWSAQSCSARSGYQIGDVDVADAGVGQEQLGELAGELAGADDAEGEHGCLLGQCGECDRPQRCGARVRAPSRLLADPSTLGTTIRRTFRA